MKIAVASGKGGTGKTTIATNLARLLAQRGERVQYLDCDVEEPNGHIFLKPSIEDTSDVMVLVPEVNLERCTGCGKCGQLCQYSAIVVLKDAALTFEQLCHSCGGCSLVCPNDAIVEKGTPIGIIRTGISLGIGFVQGRLKIGDVRSPALIKEVKRHAADDGIVVIDAPPGTSCPVIEAVSDTDYVLLVTEPTPFGLNDLELAVGMVRAMKLPFAVVINRSDSGDDRVCRYCEQEDIEILSSLPDDRRVAEAYSSGHMAIDLIPEYAVYFENMVESIKAI